MDSVRECNELPFVLCLLQAVRAAPNYRAADNERTSSG
ncbi:hypothetical protein C4K39_2372 [Pseudomonas sessilinigenes]|nr:hypothetical protein C4K39_2372 [Pseudomonas sessilinigenes]